MKASEIEANFKKKYGDAIGGQGPELPRIERVSTGYFMLDLSTKGGIPKGCCTIIYGPESSCKTTIALKTIAQHQKAWPDQACFFFDIENSYDPEWARKLGVDVESLHVYRPEYAEMAVDMVEQALAASDTGIVVLDSIAALTTSAEIEDPADKAQVGGAARIVSKLVRKVNTQLNLAAKAGRMPAMVYINQIRNKIGVLYGDPETMPGGNAIKFQSSMTIRLYGRAKEDKTVSKAIAPVREIRSIVKKHKVQIIGTHAEWDIVMVPHKGLSIGEADDWNTLLNLMKKHGLLAKDGNKGWVMDGGEYKNQQEVKEALLDDPVLLAEVRELLFDRVEAALHGTIIGDVAEAG